MSYLAAGVAALLASIASTEASRRLLRRSGVLDVPNERSSHEAPVVRGAGIGLVIAWCAVTAAIAWRFRWPPAILGLIVMAALLGALGFADDRRSLHPALRLFAQLVISTGILALGVRIEYLRIPHVVTVNLGVAGLVVSVVAIVASINLFNFMDGIDGLAGAQVLVFACVLTVAAALHGATLVGLVAAALAGAAAGFLPFNWSPAHCFMGDAGSYACGGLVAGLLMVGDNEGLPLVIVGLSALPFFLDAITTLLARMIRRETVWLPHRKHVYQRLVAAGWSHTRVTMFYVCAGALLGFGAVLLVGTSAR
jgi:UDP-N-acetylmuramyl pentapeptide phosphotransferase/UDP-N-acetylglucosamine-1-phosphate transferase